MPQRLDAKSTFSANRVIDQQDVDVIITDSPLPLSILYTTNEALLVDDAFEKVVMNVFNSYHNCNYYLNRTKGRNQTEAESDEIAIRMKNLLREKGIHYVETTGDVEGYQKVVDDVTDYIKFLKDRMGYYFCGQR